MLMSLLTELNTKFNRQFYKYFAPNGAKNTNGQASRFSDLVTQQPISQLRLEPG